jgi:hypothetical protein
VVIVFLLVADTPGKKLPAQRGPKPRLRHLNGEIFYSLKEAQIVIEAWRRH